MDCMRLAWASDTHLDAADWHYDLVQQVQDNRADGLVICGDVAEGPFLAQALQRLAADMPVPVWFVLGNHDYYGAGFWKTRRMVISACKRGDSVQWLSRIGVVRLSHTTALIGDDGWYDLRAGNLKPDFVAGSLEDFAWNPDLCHVDNAALAPLIQRLADRSTLRLQRKLRQAIQSGYRRVVLATHVPPYLQVCRHRDKPTSHEQLPIFCNTGLGRMLAHEMAAQPMLQLTVLCGHTHTSAEVQVLPNVQVLVGAAEYGYPRLTGVLE